MATVDPAKLDSRKKIILKVVIEEYIADAEPIASEAIAKKSALGVKSATIRNELAEMSEMGLLEKPHTSAGRVPSDLGYRYFVDYLVEPKKPSRQTVESISSASSEPQAIQLLLVDTTRTLSHLSHLLTIAYLARDLSLTIKHAALAPLSSTSAMMVIVLSNGEVVNKLVPIPAALKPEELGILNHQLAQEVAGKNVRAVPRLRLSSANVPPHLHPVIATIQELLKSSSKELIKKESFVAGEEYLLAQPEFRQRVDALLQILEIFQDPEGIAADLTTQVQEVTVSIGKEHYNEALTELSIVRRAFYAGENEAGTLAIVGPRRMSYSEAMMMVNLTAKMLTDSINRILGIEPQLSR